MSLCAHASGSARSRRFAAGGGRQPFRAGVLAFSASVSWLGCSLDQREFHTSISTGGSGPTGVNDTGVSDSGPPAPSPEPSDARPIESPPSPIESVQSSTGCDANPCGAQQTCVSVGLGARCDCPPGHRVDGKQCIDIDECANGSAGCQQICTNAPGSFACSCTSGYEPDAADPRRCIGNTGAECTSNPQCESGACTDGACCSVSACGTCERCAAPSGTCQPVTDADDPDTCARTRSCNSLGQCKTRDGSTCGLGSDCLSGFCSDGICCSSACSDPCRSCSEPALAGICTPIVHRTDADSCAGQGQICSTASACLRVDQVVPGPALTVVGMLGFPAYAQVVQPAISGQLREIWLSLFCYDPEERIIAELRDVLADGTPGNNVLGRAQVDLSTLPEPVVFEPSVRVQSGVPIALVIGTLGGGSRPEGGNCNPGLSPTGYEQGRLFYLPEGSAIWVELTDYDLVAETLVAL